VATGKLSTQAITAQKTLGVKRRRCLSDTVSTLPNESTPLAGTQLRALRRRAPDVKQEEVSLFESIVWGGTRGGLSVVKLVRDGYPVTMRKAASSFFKAPDKRIRDIAHVPGSTASRLEKKSANIDAGATVRVYRMGAVTRFAIEVFESEVSAINWRCQPNHALGDVAPLDLMDTEAGGGSVRQVLNAIATGGVV
jgi:putative toxin-antitoxin system antitoxin component (TIGR02293 family)